MNLVTNHISLLYSSLKQFSNKKGRKRTLCTNALAYFAADEEKSIVALTTVANVIKLFFVSKEEAK